jgi:5-methylthioadenosine/S-adenosylhomocysteine deaminase
MERICDAMPAKPFDLIVFNGMALTMDADFTVLQKALIGVRRGRLVEIGSWPETQPLPAAREAIDARGGLILPGLVNAHTHLPMALFRGLADDLPLERWLNDHIFPAEARIMAPEAVRAGTRLACAELLLGGVTTCCDGYFLETHVAEAVVESGMRAVLGQGVVDFPAPGVADPGKNIRTAADFVQVWRDRHLLITPSIFCHSPYTCSAQTLVQAKRATRAAGVLFQIHAAETLAEAASIQRQEGLSPTAYLDRLGLLDQRTLLVHAVWTDEDDIATMARRGVAVVHAPESNMKLASGICPVTALLEAGIRVGLGSDGCASNNNQDLFGEMGSAARLQKAAHQDPAQLSVAAVLKMATIEGARAIGLGHEVGSLEVGKAADVIVIDTNQPHLIPLYSAASHLVYAARAADVRHVIVAGATLVKDGTLLSMPVAAVMAEARRWGREIAAL